LENGESVGAVVSPFYADVGMFWHRNGLVRHKPCGPRNVGSCTNFPFGTATAVMETHTVVVVGCIRIVGNLVRRYAGEEGRASRLWLAVGLQKSSDVCRDSSWGLRARAHTHTHTHTQRLFRKGSNCIN